MFSRSRTLLDEGVVIPAEEQAQCRAALRALLAKPLLVADSDGETLVLVRRHLPELRDWLASRRRFRDGAAVQDRPGPVRRVPSGTRAKQGTVQPPPVRHPVPRPV